MALRVRADGRILCAAIHPPEPGDVYIPDDLSYQLTVEHHVLVTEPMERHASRGEWWWANAVPEGIEVERWWE